MLKFFHVTRISNFCKFLVDFNSYFKHVVLSHLDELLGLPYMVGKLEMSSSQFNLSRKTILHVASNMSQTLHEGLVCQIFIRFV
jgi:hypothetical protein